MLLQNDSSNSEIDPTPLTRSLAGPPSEASADNDVIPPWRWATLKPVLACSVFVLLSGIPTYLTKPELIEVKKAYFGSDQKAALAQSICDSARAIVNLFLSMFYSRLIDAYGRKPFFVASAVSTTAAYVLLVAFPTQPLIFMIALEVSLLVQPSFIYAYITDVVHPGKRAHGLGISAAFRNIQQFAALLVAVVPAANRVFYGAAAAVSLVSCGVALLLTESLPVERRTRMSMRGLVNPFAGFSVMFRSRSLIICTVLVAFIATADVGAGEVYLYYLNQRVDFDKHDAAFFMVEMGVLSPLGLLVVMPLLLRVLSPPFVLAIGLLANTAIMIVVATIWAKWPVYAFAAPVMALMACSYPITQSLVTNVGSADEIAKRLTALNAVMDVALAVGPLVFGALYSQLSGTMVAVPFFVSAAICFAGAILATLIPAAVRFDDKKREELERVDSDVSGVTFPLTGCDTDDPGAAVPRSERED